MGFCKIEQLPIFTLLVLLGTFKCGVNLELFWDNSAGGWVHRRPTGIKSAGRLEGKMCPQKIFMGPRPLRR